LIDKENAPSDVIEVIAVLSREGVDTLTGSLNLLSGSSAEILFESIPAGTWHLKVDAVDSLDVVLYTGATEVLITAGFTTQVSLVLEPTGAGTGNVYIFVTWGTILGNWEDFSRNPILSSSGSFYDSYGVEQSNVIFTDRNYKMWYVGDAGASKKYVLFAESNNGINWERPSPTPVLFPGPQGSWDDLAVHPGAIIFDEGLYTMFYVGFSNSGGEWGIGLAESVNGVNWEKYPNPVLMSTAGWESQIASSSAIKVRTTYYLYYYGRNLLHLNIGLATSNDKINWTRYHGNPILTSDQPWEETGVYYPSVIMRGKEYIMIYMNASGTGFGKATSSDGINWRKDDSNPFFTKEDTFNNWADDKIAYPFYIRNNNSERIYYTGFDSWNFSYQIGFVEK
jgi:predicted GH43/DUF377 family glycosyl hydrolase